MSIKPKSSNNTSTPTTKYFTQSPTATTEILPSPQSIQGEVLVHLSHPQHPLLRVSFPYIFTCAGCKDFGAGQRFRCGTCNYDLHEFCALAPPSIHPAGNSIHTQHQLVFHTKPGGGLLRSRCGVCGKAIRGYCFRCSTCNFEIHPCCSKLRQEMSFSVHPHHRLTLLPTSTPTSGGGDHQAAASLVVCGVCNRKRLGRVYGCEECGYQIHAVCAKPMVNGLYDSGIIKAPETEKPTMLGTAARVATHVILGFIGGLIEGIGEGIGEVLVDSKGKGKSFTPRRTNSMRAYPPSSSST